MTQLPQPLPDLSSLDLLVSVGELGSISAAASAHLITQPAASMRLRSLERVLGLRLLERSRAGSRLTPEGAATAQWAAAVLDDARSLLAGVAALRAAGGQLAIGASMTVAEYVMPQWLERLAGRDSALGVSLHMGNTSEVADMVRNDDVQIGFIEGPRPPGRLRSRDLWGDELVVVVARNHPWARRRKPVGPTELASTPLLLRERGSGTRDVLTDALADVGLEPLVAMELGSTTAIKAAVAAGQGPAILSALAVGPELRIGTLVVVPHEGIDLRRVIRAIWRSGAELTDGVQHLLEIARTVQPSRET
jgi:DNA-binding transcriptional LysR family regulator